MKTIIKINSLILLAIMSFSTAQAQFGTLDSSFATNGTFQSTGSSSQLYTRAMAELGNGKLLTASHYRITSSNQYFSQVVKLNNNGTYDNSFGGLGIFVIPNGSVFNIRINAMKVQPDGKIVVAGTCNSTASTSSTRTFFVARIQADGSGLDNLFNSGQGYISAPLLASVSPSSVSDVLLTASGKILIVGNTVNQTTGFENIAIARLNSDGSHDNTFGFLGTYAFSQENKYNQATCATQLANGDILVGGLISITATNLSGIIVKVLADGSAEDVSWSSNGYNYPMSGVVNAVKLLPSGEVICAGTFDNKMHACKLNSTGALVSSFGTLGIFALNGGISTSFDMDVQTDGKIVVGGKIENTTGKENLCLLRLNTDGTLDNTFGQSGIVDLTISATGDDFARDIAINSMGNIYAYGGTDGEEFLSKFNGFWPTATDDIYKNIDFAVYPNPGRQNLNINLNGSYAKEAKVIVYSVIGKKLFTQKINTTRVTKIDISALVSGQYIVQLQDKEQRTIASQKFNVQ